VAGLEFERVERECDCGEVDDGDGRARYISPSTDIGSLGLVDEGRIVGRVVIFFKAWSDRRHVDGRSIGQDPGDGRNVSVKTPELEGGYRCLLVSKLKEGGSRAAGAGIVPRCKRYSVVVERKDV
jgi:hypothetical protein